MIDDSQLLRKRDLAAGGVLGVVISRPTAEGTRLAIPSSFRRHRGLEPRTRSSEKGLDGDKSRYCSTRFSLSPITAPPSSRLTCHACFFERAPRRTCIPASPDAARDTDVAPGNDAIRLATNREG